MTTVQLIFLVGLTHKGLHKMAHILLIEQEEQLCGKTPGIPYNIKTNVPMLWRNAWKVGHCGLSVQSIYNSHGSGVKTTCLVFGFQGHLFGDLWGDF